MCGSLISVLRYESVEKFTQDCHPVGIKDPPVTKPDQEREKILTRQFLLIKRVQARIHSS
jgi:hypothetical protein